MLLDKSLATPTSGTRLSRRQHTVSTVRGCMALRSNTKSPPRPDLFVSPPSCDARLEDLSGTVRFWVSTSSVRDPFLSIASERRWSRSKTTPRKTTSSSSSKSLRDRQANLKSIDVLVRRPCYALFRSALAMRVCLAMRRSIRSVTAATLAHLWRGV